MKQSLKSQRMNSEIGFMQMPQITRENVFVAKLKPKVIVGALQRVPQNQSVPRVIQSTESLTQIIT